MARKSWMYSVLEAVQYEMRQRKDMVWLFELTPRWPPTRASR